MKLAENLTYFAENTSIHGLVQIAKKSSSMQKRLIWLVIFVLSMIYAGTQIAEEAKCKHITEGFIFTLDTVEDQQSTVYVQGES